MNLSSFTFIVTDSCNFNCSYCYQKKDNQFLSNSTLKKAITCFFPVLEQECNINFTGGEPLLAFEQIKRAVNLIQNKNRRRNNTIHYSITTNGSLINDDILCFLNDHHFYLMLSFDGYAQDILRKNGSFKPMLSILKKIQRYPDISLETNSVFTFETVRHLSKSIQFFMESGVPRINLAISYFPAWNAPSLQELKKELIELRKFCILFYTKNKTIPLTMFNTKTKKGLFRCFAGQDRMSLAPDGTLWGCYLFADYFKKKEKNQGYSQFCFGDLNSFIKNHKDIYSKISSNYSKLCLQYFYTSEKYCLSCDKLQVCRVCPIEAAFTSSNIGEIPTWVCEIKKIINEENDIFWTEMEN